MDSELGQLYSRLGILDSDGNEKRIGWEELIFILSRQNYATAQQMEKEPARKVYRWMLLEIKRQQQIEIQIANQQLDQESLASLGDVE